MRMFNLLTLGNQIDADLVEQSRIWEPHDAAKFMAAWLSCLYLDNETITLELQPGDITCYRFCITTIISSVHTAASPTHILWHDCTNDYYVCLPTKVLSSTQLLKYVLSSGRWNSVTLAVLAELHCAFCDHFLQSHDAIVATYKPRFYDWIRHTAIIEEPSIEKEEE